MAASAYIHIPFCSHKCDFCDFAAYAGLDDLSTEYCSIVVKEIETRLAKEPNDEILRTVFFGGGTPGYIEAELLDSILSALRLSCGIASDAEITIETTPQSISESKASKWLSAGINRISIGIESLNDHELQAMGRDHSAEAAIEGVRLASKSGFENLALDLMYGLPEQTLDSWKETLNALFALKPKHLSSYGLTIAQNSPLLLRYPRDSSKYPDEETYVQMYELLTDCSKEAGLEQYEISNFAIPGYESRHNLSYWRNQEYLAFGVSAHRYYRGKRSSNFRSLKRYMRSYTEDESSEIIEPGLKLKEAVFLGLRLSEGLDLSGLKERYGFDLLKDRKEKIEEFQKYGLLELSDGRLRLSRKGFLLSNSVMAELI